MKSEIIVFGRIIPVYGLLGITGIIFGMLYLFRQCRAKKLCFDDAVYIYTAALITAMIGAKLLYVVLRFPVLIHSFTNNTGHTLALLHGYISGGFVFYGGLIGGVLGAIFAARYFGLRLSDYYGGLVPVIPLIHIFGRAGCFLTGCCYGVQTSGGLHVIYETSRIAPNGIPLVPVQMIETVCNLLIFLLLHFLAKKQQLNCFLLDCYILCYAPIRFILEFFRGDPERGSLWVFSTSQWISLLLMLCCAVHIYLLTRKVPS